MAQTIAAQRGTTTVTGNGSASATLFTQSTGTATRVILSSVSAKHDEVTADFLTMSLLINVNATGNLALVAQKQASSSTNGRYGMAMMPGSNLYPYTSITSSSPTYLDRWVQTQVGIKEYLGTTAYYRSNWYGPNGQSAQGYLTSWDNVPSQFWINSGDSVIVKYWNSSANTVDILYSFTTITES
jgi:hypothetical protein